MQKMKFDDFEKEIDDLTAKYESAREYCVNAYREETAAGKMDAFRWLAIKKYWHEKISLLKEIKELVQEFRDVRVE